MTMAQTISMANGFLNFTGVIDLQANKICDTIWPQELDGEFRDKFVVGSGATACVFLAYDQTDTLVAVKVGKSSSGKAKEASLKSWQAECSDMQSMRMKGCKAGSKMLQLHEQYLPTCTKVGPHANGAYYVMHAAGKKGIKDSPNLGFSLEQKKQVFAELVTSIYALHAVDLTHNDLHGTNIVLDDTQLALIDFGSLKTLERSWKRDYKRDSNAIWRWGAVLGDCPADATWPNPPTRRAGDRFLACMKLFSGGEPQFMDAIGKVVDGDIRESKDHGVTALFKSKFVQDHMPTPKKHYPWVGTGDCLSWSDDKWAEFEFKQNFPNYVKCDTLPTYVTIKKKEKKGKVTIRETKQCNLPNQVFNSACWSKTAGQIWACGGCGNGVVNGNADGGCLFESHPQYKHAPAYK